MQNIKCDYWNMLATNSVNNGFDLKALNNDYLPSKSENIPHGEGQANR